MDDGGLANDASLDKFFFLARRHLRRCRLNLLIRLSSGV
jgi:hypothetical protein